jgi:hypothetical protein
LPACLHASLPAQVMEVTAIGKFPTVYHKKIAEVLPEDVDFKLQI